MFVPERMSRHVYVTFDLKHHQQTESIHRHQKSILTQSNRGVRIYQVLFLDDGFLVFCWRAIFELSWPDVGPTGQREYYAHVSKFSHGLSFVYKSRKSSASFIPFSFKARSIRSIESPRQFQPFFLLISRVMHNKHQ